ncbi:hypothetical protein HDK77DRAFT_261301 [Phyllosticta capitalensis]
MHSCIVIFSYALLMAATLWEKKVSTRVDSKGRSGQSCSTNQVRVGCIITPLGRYFAITMQKGWPHSANSISTCPTTTRAPDVFRRQHSQVEHTGRQWETDWVGGRIFSCPAVCINHGHR